MKLKNLCEAFEQQTGTFPDTSQPQDGVRGSGLYSSVTGDKDPFMINKKQHAHMNDRAYAIYVKFITDNKLAQANPHFPRIYEIGDGKWKMEKLPYTLRQYFEYGEDDENDQHREIICNMYLHNYDPQRFTYWDFSDPSKIKLGTYKKALKIIYDYRKKHNDSIYDSDEDGKYLGDDLHNGNIMVRLTPQGPQLVITDPWC